MTMASAPASSSGSQASMRRRASSRAAVTSLRWKRRAPQQPAPGAGSSVMPSRSSTRTAAALMLGYIDGCTQPASSIMIRPWMAVGREPASVLGGTLARRRRGSSGRTRRPTFIAAPKSPGLGRPFFRTSRRARSPARRGTFASSTARPMSSSRE